MGKGDANQDQRSSTTSTSTTSTTIGSVENGLTGNDLNALLGYLDSHGQQGAAAFGDAVGSFNKVSGLLAQQANNAQAAQTERYDNLLLTTQKSWSDVYQAGAGLLQAQTQNSRDLLATAAAMAQGQQPTFVAVPGQPAAPGVTDLVARSAPNSQVIGWAVAAAAGLGALYFVTRR